MVSFMKSVPNRKDIQKWAHAQVLSAKSNALDYGPWVGAQYLTVLLGFLNVRVNQGAVYYLLAKKCRPLAFMN